MWELAHSKAFVLSSLGLGGRNPTRASSGVKGLRQRPDPLPSAGLALGSSATGGRGRLAAGGPSLGRAGGPPPQGCVGMCGVGGTPQVRVPQPPPTQHISYNPKIPIIGTPRKMGSGGVTHGVSGMPFQPTQLDSMKTKKEKKGKKEKRRKKKKGASPIPGKQGIFWTKPTPHSGN